jgi:hypothetical protein
MRQATVMAIPDSPPKPCLCRIAAEMAATTGPHQRSPSHETNWATMNPESAPSDKIKRTSMASFHPWGQLPQSRPTKCTADLTIAECTSDEVHTRARSIGQPAACWARRYDNIQRAKRFEASSGYIRGMPGGDCLVRAPLRREQPGVAQRVPSRRARFIWEGSRGPPCTDRCRRLVASHCCRHTARVSSHCGVSAVARSLPWPRSVVFPQAPPRTIA